MSQEFAGDFYARRAQETEGSIRWTDERMLEHDRTLIDSVLPAGGDLLDLGCGTGDLFATFLDRLGHVTAVDRIPEFIARLPRDPKVEGVVSDLLSFAPTRGYDLALLFGVVTYLTPEQERTVYERLRDALRPGGRAVVKNQCARGDEKRVDGWSEAIGQRYVGRYPSLDAQRQLLDSVFGQVSVRPYPDHLNPWPDTLHVAFVCT